MKDINHSSSCPMENSFLLSWCLKGFAFFWPRIFNVTSIRYLPQIKHMITIRNQKVLCGKNWVIWCVPACWSVVLLSWICSFSCVKMLHEVWEMDMRFGAIVATKSGTKSQMDRWGERRRRADLRERDQEIPRTRPRTHGKSNQAISKPSGSAPATLASRNYNTIWQRYWA